jgi:hypothetical protein
MMGMADLERISCSVLFAALLGVSALSGCASPLTASAHGGGAGKGMMTKDCPMHDPSSKLSVEDVEVGVALGFTTAGDAGKLRAHVRHMAEQHNREGMMDSRAVAEDIEGGARLVLTPNDPTQLAALREHARMHAESMRKGECPMMQMHGTHAKGADDQAPESHEGHEGHAPKPQ